MRELAPGAVVAGYRIESLVGRGGMGVVYRAVQLGLDRVVALKVIAPELLDDDDVRARFLAEARAAASVDHPNVIPVHDGGRGRRRRLHRDAVRRPATTCARWSAAAGRSTRPRRPSSSRRPAPRWTRSTAPASSTATSSPRTCSSTASGHVYLTDFGLAKAVLTRSGGTRTGQWVGTLDYVSPEQIRGGRIDARADVYALGGVLHFALTGRVPFEREGDEAKLWAQLSAPPPVPSALRRGLPAQFDVAVARAMAKDAGRALPVGRRPRPRGARRRGRARADRAGADGRARRRRARRRADRAGAGRRGLDAHRRAVRGRAPAPPPARAAAGRRRALLAVVAVARRSLLAAPSDPGETPPRATAARRPRRPRRRPPEPDADRDRRRATARRRSRTSATARTGSRSPAATCGSRAAPAAA